MHWNLDSRARLALLQGEPRRALVETLECGRRFEEAGRRNPAFMPWRSRAASCLTRLDEERERARDLAAEELALAQAFGAPRALGRALRITGLVTGELERLREAVDVLEPSIARLELAYALCDLGSALVRSGERAAPAGAPAGSCARAAGRRGASPRRARTA